MCEDCTAILAQNKRMRDALKAIEKIPSCQDDDCCYGGKVWSLAFDALREIDPDFQPSDCPDINEVDEPESSHIHARLQRMEGALREIAEPSSYPRESMQKIAKAALEEKP